MKYNPHSYQKYAADFIDANPISCLLLDMGLGKTSITLTAIKDLLFDSFQVHKVLVIAPLRVARDTWPEELRKWEHLSDLWFSVAVGTEAERKAALRAKADIYIINRENVQWLIEDSGLTEKGIICHSEGYKLGIASNHGDVMHWFPKHGKSMDTLRAEVKKLLEAAVTPTPTPTEPKMLYHVQVGVYSVKANADSMLAKVKAAGFVDAFIKTE